MKNDTIYPFTRIVAAIVIPVLWLAFLILFFSPNLTGERFAWQIKPDLTSLYIGAGYLGGSWLFINTVIGKRWHRIHGAFPPVTAFTWFMLIATLLHWDKFSHGTLGFYAWTIIYIITPFLIPAIWLYNRREDPGEPEESDVRISPFLSWLPRIFGVIALTFAVIGFISPQIIISTWPWTLTPLTARVMAGWVALLGVGGLTMSFDRRWTAWRIPLESIFIWHVLVVFAFFMKSSDFTAGMLNWFTIFVFVLVTIVPIFYIFMENRRRKSDASSATPQ